MANPNFQWMECRATMPNWKLATLGLATVNITVRDASLPDESYGIMVADAILEIHIAWRDAMRLFCHGGFGVRCAER